MSEFQLLSEAEPCGVEQPPSRTLNKSISVLHTGIGSSGRPAGGGPRRHIGRIAAGLLLALVGLVAVSSQATAQTTLVSNIGQTDSTSNTNVSTATIRAQQFETGSNADGYTLSEVVVNIREAKTGSNAFALYSSTASDRPDTKLVDLSGNSSSAGEQSFTPDETTVLAASTKYFIVFDMASGSANLQRTGSNDIDTGAAAGWDIADHSWFSSDGMTWTLSGPSFEIAIKGTAAADTTAPTFSSATVDGTSLEITFNENLAAAANLANSAFTVKKTPDSDSEETVSLSGSPSISGATVTLTLASAVLSTDTAVKVSYTKPTSGSNNKLKDASDNEVASFTDQAVTNDTTANSPATGAPRITGVARVGSTLTAGKGDIADADGLTNSTFPGDYTFQWIRVDSDGSSNPMDVGTDANTYTPVAADIGKKLTVEVSFTDDDSNDESRTSAAFPATGTVETAVTLDSVLIKNLNQSDNGSRGVGKIGSAQTAYATRFMTGANTGGFTLTSVQLRIETPAGSTLNRARHVVTVREAASGNANNPSDTVLYTLSYPGTLSTGVKTFTAPANATLEENTRYFIHMRNSSELEGNRFGLQLTNSNAEDSGGETGWSIENVSRKKPGGAAWTNVVGNPTIKMAVRGTAVPDTTAPTVSSATVDGASLEITFNEDLAAAANLANGAFTVKKTPESDSEQTVSLSGSPSISDATVTLTLASAVLSTDTDVKVSYTKPTSGSDNKLKDASDNEVASFTDQAVTNDTTANSPATGAPLITGPPQAGEALTSVLGTIADTDDLPTTPFPDGFSFQWIRVDSDGSSNPVNIGTNSRSYTPVADDVGKKIKLEVTFIDGGGTEETRPSLAYPSGADTIVAAKTACPDGSEWCTDLTVGLTEIAGHTQDFGYDPFLHGTLDDDTIEAGSETYTVAILNIQYLLTGTMDETIRFGTNTSLGFGVDLPRGTVLNLNGTELIADSDSETILDGRYAWDRPTGFEWIENQKVTVSANLPPLLESATVDGTSLVLTYHEDLDDTSTPAASAFSVTVDGTAAAPSSVSISDDQVTLTLAEAVASTEVVTVSYTVPASNPLQDEYDISALAFTDEAVTNTTGDTNTPATGAPAITGPPHVGQTLTAGIGTIEDADDLPPTTFPTGYDFQWIRVDADGSSNPANIGTNSSTYTPVADDVGKKIKLDVTFDDVGGTEETVTSDAYPSQGIPDSAIGILAAKSACPTNAQWCAELTVGILTQGSDSAYGYNQLASIGALDDASFMSSGPTTHTVTSILLAAGTPNGTVTVSFGEYLPLGSILTLSGTDLTATATSRLSTLGNYSWTLPASLSMVVAQKMTVSVNLPPSLDGATVNGTSLVLTYAEDLDDTSTPAAGAYSVTVDGTAATPSSVAVSGKTVTLTLASAVTSGQTVTVSYTVPVSNPLQDESGLDAPALTDQAVTNTTGDTNTPATGAPAITGVPQVGQMLTATIGSIEDADGLTNSSFPGDYTLQWVRVDGGSETDISTSGTYTLVSADEGKTIKLEVSFTDDESNAEGPLESVETATVAAAAENCATDRPNADWCTLMTVGRKENGPFTLWGYALELGGYGTLADSTIDYGKSTYTFSRLRINAQATVGGVDIKLDAHLPSGSTFDLGGTAFMDGEDPDDVGEYSWVVAKGFGWQREGQRVTVSANLAPGLDGATVDGTSLVLTYAEDLDDTSTPAVGAYSVTVDGTAAEPSSVAVSGKTVTLTLLSAVTAGQTVTVSYTVPASNPLQDESGLDAPAFTDFDVTNTTTGGTANATGAPEVTGVPQVGKVLTAGIGTIADDDGLPTTFPDDYTFQWVRVSGGTETDISSATSSTYTLASADEGKTIKVKVSFTDDESNSEGPLASDAYPGRRSVVPAAGPCPVDNFFCGLMTVGLRPGDENPKDGENEGIIGFAGKDYGLIDGVDNASFTFEGTSIVFLELYLNYFAANQESWYLLVNIGDFDPEIRDFVYLPSGVYELRVDGKQFVISDETSIGQGFDDFRFYDIDGVNWFLGQDVRVSLAAAPPPVKIKDATATPDDHYAAFTVSLAAKAPKDVRFQFRTTGGTANYENLSRTFTIPAGTRSRKVYVELLNDSQGNKNTVGSTVDVEIHNAQYTDGSKQVIITDGEATGTIVAAPRSTTAVSGYSLFASGGPCFRDHCPPTADSPGNLEFLVALTPSAHTLGEDVCFNYKTIAGGTATAGVDYMTTQGRGRLSADTPGTWVSTTSVPVPVTNNPAEGKTVLIRISNGHVCGDAARAVSSDDIASATATGTIGNSDGSQLSVSDAAATEGEEEWLDFVVTLSPAAADTVTVDYATSDGTATQGEDYTAQSDTLTFAAGETSKTVSVAISDDTEDDDGETMTFTLSNATNAAIGDGEAIGTIRETGADSTVLGATFSGLPEAHDGATAFTFTLTLSEDVAGLSHKTLRDSAFQVSGGSVAKASRQTQGSNEAWTIEIEPDGDGAVEITLPATEDCTATGALCASGGRMLSAAVSATVSGPTAEPLTASFSALPEAHDGAAAFTFTLTLSEDVADLSYRTLRDSAFQVSGGSVAKASRQTQGSNEAWTIEIEPDGDGAVEITLPATEDCTATGALCASGGRMLSASVSATVPGPTAETVLAEPLTASFSALPSEHDGSSRFQLRIRFTEELAERSGRKVARALSLSGATRGEVRRVGDTRDFFEVPLTPSGYGEVTISLGASSGCSATDSVCTTDGRALSDPVEVTIPGPPALSVQDAEVEEGADAALAFVVTLSRVASGTVTVAYATSDGTATAGQDYEDTSGTLTFAASETSKTVSVPVHNDDHDDGGETLRLRLSNASGAYIGLEEATGTITNSGLMPGAWLSRFGRVAADQAVTAIGERVRDGRRPELENQITLGGRRMDQLYASVSRFWSKDSVEREPALASPLSGGQGAAAPMGGSPMAVGPINGGHMGVGQTGGSLMNGGRMGLGRTNAGPMNGGSMGSVQTSDSPMGGGQMGSGPMGGGQMNGGEMGGGLAGDGMSAERGSQASWDTGVAMALQALGVPSELIYLTSGQARPDLRTLLMGSSFDYSRSSQSKPGWLGDWSAWGRTAATRFAGAEEGMTVNGDVATATVGFDSHWNRWLGGVALSYSDGEGSYARPGVPGGHIRSSLTTLLPYLSYSINEQSSVWGTLGYGVGALSLTPGGAESPIDTDMSSMLAAFGGRGVLDARVAGLQLAVVSDAMLTRTESEAVSGLNGAAGATSRVRLMLEGAGSVELGGGALLPRVEAGLRYDAGDAETGAGIEVGGGLAYTTGRLSVQIDARGLITHQDAAYSEWGYSGSLVYAPGLEGRGLSMTLGSTLGAVQSGVQSMWAQADASSLVRPDGAAGAQRRFQAEFGYGLRAGYGRELLWTPFLALETLGEGARGMRFGLNVISGEDQALGAVLEFGHRQSGPGTPAESAVMLSGSLRF